MPYWKDLCKDLPPPKFRTAAQDEWAYDICTYDRMEAWLSTSFATTKSKEYALKRMHEISAKYPSAKLNPPATLENYHEDR